jgi:hypothetical protein
MSEWNGLPHDACKGEFRAFLDRLREDGFTCEPRSSDLQDNPDLLRKGAKDLPGESDTAITA